MKNSFDYRTDIDGLRALAILLVVFYHTGLGCSGGFVGVDVFFVISGYLITSLIKTDLDQKTFSFIGFWFRRAKRILPAFFVVSLAVSVTAYFLYLPTDIWSLGRALIAQSAFAANVYYYPRIDYFSGPVEELPLLHMWSLAVEEQFYFMIPFLLWGIAFFKRGSLLIARAFLIVLIVTSFGFSVIRVKEDPSATFYLLPTRFWELALGSFLAFVPPSFVLLRYRWLAEGIGLGGLIAILYASFTYSSQTVFPAAAALLPTLGTVAIIYANVGVEQGSYTRVGNVFSWPVFRFLGWISYSWYLWHWPILSFSHYLDLDMESLLVRLGCLFLGFFAGVLSWFFIERPFRRKKFDQGKKIVFGSSLWGLGLLTAIGFLFWKASDRLVQVPKAVESVLFEETRINRLEVPLDRIRNKKLPSLGVDHPEEPVRLLLWGDSHAMAIAGTVDRILQQRQLKGVVAAYSSTAPVINWYHSSTYGLQEEGLVFNNEVFSYICEEGVECVILHAFWVDYIQSPHGASFGQALVNTVRLLREQQVKVIVLQGVPVFRQNVPRVITRKFRKNASSIDQDLFLAPVEAYYLDNDGLSEDELRMVMDLGAIVLNPKPLFYSSEKDQSYIYKDGVVLYRDHNHLSNDGAQYMLSEIIERHLGK